MRKKAFTLAEMLIVIAVIGVVAAMTIPTVIANIQANIKKNRVTTIEHKLSEAMDKMLVVDGLNGYSSTLDFVNTLKDHYKIVKICDNNNLSDCWPYKTAVIRKNGKTVDIADLKTGSDLKMTDDDSNTWSDTVSILTADGVPMLMSYNTGCNINKYNTPTWGGSKSSSTNCLAVAFDWNAGDKPNKFNGIIDEDSDIVLMNANGFGDSCAFETDGICFGTFFQPTAITASECNELKDDLKIQNCFLNPDYWAGAVNACGGTGNMPDIAALKALAGELYDDGKLNTDKTAALGLGTSGFAVWSGEEYSSLAGNAYNQHFNTTRTYSDIQPNRGSSGLQAVCLVN